MLFLSGKILRANDLTLFGSLPLRFSIFPEDESPPRCPPPCWMQKARESVENIRYECGCILPAPDAARSTDRRAGIRSRQDIRTDVSAFAGQGPPPLVFPVERHGKKIKTWVELTAYWSHGSLRYLHLGPLSDLILRGWLWWRLFFFFFFQEERCRSLCMRWWEAIWWRRTTLSCF